MTTALLKSHRHRAKRDISAVVSELREAKNRFESLLREAEALLGKPASRVEAQPRTSPLDQMKEVLAINQDLRVPNGNLSAELVAKLFGVSVSQLADWLGRSRQAVAKTPDADSLQAPLAFFERVARLRLALRNEAEFRKWLRTTHELLGNRSPLDLLAAGKWQALADYVNDALTGAST